MPSWRSRSAGARWTSAPEGDVNRAAHAARQYHARLSPPSGHFRPSLAMNPLRPVLLALAFAASGVHAHGHMPALDDNDPLTADIRLCNAVVDAALLALRDRERAQAPRLLEGADLRSELINEVTRHVFAEEQIRSQKFAMAYARARCNEALQERRHSVEDAGR